MFKTLSIVAGIVVLAVIGLIFLNPSQHESSYREVSLKSIKGLQDCKMIAIETDGDKIYIVRCPSSEVSVHWNVSNRPYFSHTSNEYEH